VYLAKFLTNNLIPKKKMAIKFKTVPRNNPQDMEAPQKYYASSIGNGETDMEALAEMIAYQSTLTDTDCYAVLRSLEHNIINELKQGRIVKLGSLGNFQVSISAKGQENAEDVTANDIVKSRILFRPGKKLRNLLLNLSYQKAG
jgi:predicted histone-like DNA-binding protein